MMLTYKYKLRLKEEQIKKVEHTFACVYRFKELYLNDLKKGKKISDNATELVKHYEIIDPSITRNVDYSALICIAIELAINEKTKELKPVTSYTTRVSEYLKANFPIKDNTLYLPKIGRVRFIKSREIPKGANIIRYIVSRNNLNDYYISIIFELENTFGKKTEYDNVLGLDYSATHFAVDSNGQKHDVIIPDEKEYLDKIADCQRLLSRYHYGSINYKRCVKRIDKLYGHMNNCRKDYLHKLSTKLADEYDAIVTEDLSMKQLATLRHMGRSTNHNAYYKFVEMLDYKLTARGKRLVKVGRFYPSSKTCSECGYINRNLSIDEREWICPNCGSYLDRDINAAVNIRNEGIRILNCV